MKQKFLFFIFLFGLTFNSFAQEIVQGTVYDSDNFPLIGATVVIKGTTQVVVTNADGEFQLRVPQNSVIQISYIGFKAQEIQYTGQRNLNITLLEDISSLEEVIVVAYGTEKKSHLTGAVSSLKNDRLDEIPVTRADQALQGKLAGVQVLNLNPEAGAAPTIRVRGMGSISANNEPLVVVDGYPVPDGLEMVNMGDVESIEVLKDAASSALYGSRAAGGVILITTKSGSEDKTKYSFKMYAGVNHALELPDMMSTEEYVELLYDEAELRMQDPAVDGTDATMPFNRVTNNERTAYLISKYVVDQPTNWVDEGMRNFGNIQNYQLSASGGDKSKKYYISGGYSTEDGIMKNSTYDKFSLRTKIDVELGKKVRAGVNFNPSYSEKERPRVNLTDYMRFPTWMPVRHNEATAALTGKTVGEYAQVSDFTASTVTGIGVDGNVWNMSGVNPWTSGNQTPTSIRERTTRIDQNYRLQTNTYLEFDILPGLVFRTSNGVYFSYREYNQKEKSEANKAGLPNKLTRELTLYTDLLSENILSYNKTINEHDFGGILGFSAQKASTKFNRIVGTGFPDEERLSFNMASEFLKNTSSTDGITSFYSSDALLSLLGRVNYSYKGKYLLSASMRADGSSKFADGHKWGIFPSGAVAWRISEESFMENINTINSLKLRASYGVTGNTAIHPYESLNRLGSVKYVYGNQTEQIGFVPLGIPNPDLKWESTAQIDVGFDLSMLDNRFRVTFDYYKKNTSDLLSAVVLPPSSGFSTSIENIGEIENQGLELSIGADILRNEFKWDASASISGNKNKIVKLADGADIMGNRIHIFDRVTIAREGEPLQSFFGYRENGLDEQGNIKIVDLNNDGEITPLDNTIIGNPFPDFIFGFNSNFYYKQFELNFFIEGVYGNDIWWGTAGSHLNSFASNVNQFAELWGNYWTEENPDANAKYPKIQPSNRSMNTDRYVKDGSYLRLKSLRFAYNIPTDKVSWLGETQIFISGTNLLTITNYPGIDPDVNSLGSDSQGIGDRFSSGFLNLGIDMGSYPVSKVYSLGLKLNF